MPTNSIEIRALGLQRSGNHAVLSWIQGQYPGRRVCFLNNVRHGDHDPYATCHGRVLHGFDPEIANDRLRIAPKYALIYSYEDDAGKIKVGETFMDSVFDARFGSRRAEYLGASARQYDLVIVRDPYNFFASRLRSIDRLTGVKDIEWLVENWKTLARIALSCESGHDPSVIVANYNRWRARRAYRTRLAKALGGEGNDVYLDSAPLFSGASSFADDRNATALAFRNWVAAAKGRWFSRWRGYYKGSRKPAPSGHQVVERWRHLVEDPRYERIVRDAELEDLARRLFGDTLDVDRILRTSRESRITS